MKRIYLLMLIVSFIFGTTHGQLMIPIHVSANAGGSTMGLENSALLVAGQNVIGRTTDANNSVYLGLMAPVRYVLTDVPINKNGLFQLFQNYPNPFHFTTSIKYTVGRTQFISLKIYDIFGREVTALINEEKPPGEFEINFKAHGLTSGIYYYRLKAGNFVQVKKMILLH